MVESGPDDITAGGSGQDDASGAYGQSLLEIKHGQILAGRVVRIDDDGIMVDVGYKTEGFVPRSEIVGRNAPEGPLPVQIDDTVNVYVLRIDEKEEGRLILSKRRADEDLAWRRLTELKEAGTVIEAPVTEVTKGGLVLDVGVRGFMPGSQVGTQFIKDLAPYVGKTLRCKIIDLNRRERRVILSARTVLEEERARERDQIWERLTKGQILEGAVRRLTDFGAFVDVGGVDGLLHISEMSHTRVRHPSDVLHEGDVIRVVIRNVDRENHKVSLGYRELLPDPWEAAAAEFSEGTIVEGKVVRLTGFGAFVQLAEGVDGLIHISELSDRRVAHPEEIVHVGDTVRVKILHINPELKRVALSLRQAEDRGSHDPGDSGGQQERVRYRSDGGDGGPVTIGEMLGGWFSGQGGRHR